jgi:ABC-2 type transport system permease protein
MLAIFIKELNGYLNSLIAYIVIVLFLVLTGLVLWVFPSTNILDYGFAEMDSFFQLTPYILLFLIPAITMRSFSEEFKSGTIELLFTKPISSINIVSGKYAASVLLVMLAIFPTIVYYYIISFLGNPSGNIDTAQVIGSYMGLILLAAVFVALGLCISALTDNQIIAFLVSGFTCYFLFDGIHQLAGLFTGSLGYWVDYFSLHYHYQSLSRGVIDSRNVLFMVTSIILLLLLTKNLLNHKKK